MVDSSQKLALSVEEAARRADMCRDRVYHAISAGKLRARKNGRRTVILASDLEAYLNALPIVEPRVLEG